MAKAPCKDCSERHMGCHPSCSKYLEYRNAYDKEKEKIQEKKKANGLAYDFRTEQVMKALRKRR